MKNLVVILNHSLDEDRTRNENVESRLEGFEDKGWNIDIYVVPDPTDGNILLNFLLILFRSLKVGLKIILQARKRGKTIVWSINSPAFLHLPALLAKLFSRKVKWAAEFMDAMCEEPFYSQKSVGRRMMKSLLEGPVVRFADKVITDKGSQGSVRYLKENYPEFEEKFEQLPHFGYKEENFKDIEGKKFEKFTITYAGTFYDDWINPKVFLKGFSEFVKENDVSPNKIQLKFFCKGWKEEYFDLIEKLNIEEYISISGYVPYAEIFSIMKGSDILLYIHGAKHSRKDMIHSKFYDYVGSSSSILGMAKKILRSLE